MCPVKTVPKLSTLDKNAFDIALIDGVRTELEEVYVELRQAEEAFYLGAAESACSSGEEYLIERGCPLCNMFDGLPFVTSRGMRIVRCRACGHVYSRDVYSSVLDVHMYENAGGNLWPAYLKLKEHPAFAKVERLRNIYYLEACERYARVGRLLDIGSGSGSLLYQAAERGWDVQGLDPNLIWQKILPPLINPRQGFFPDSLAPEERFDVIAMLDVIEHMVDPIKFLASTARHLTPGGIVLVQVPNINSLLIRLEGATNNNICPGHWSYFDAEALNRLARICGFETLFIETVISELDRILAFDTAQMATATTLVNIPLPDLVSLTPEWVHEHLLGYKLICILRPVAPCS